MNKRKIISSFLALVMVFTMSIVSSVPVSASTGSKKVTTSKKMSLVLSVGETNDSSTIDFKVSGLPTNAVITKLEVYTGSLSYTGGILTNYLTITSSNGRTEEIAWNGAAKKTLTTSNFLASRANGTYTISFNGTCLGGTIKNGIILDIATKSYTCPYIVVYWDDEF